jgi:hypothetical protein
MKLPSLRFLLPVAALAFLAQGEALAEKNGGSSSSAPVVIPGGSVSTTFVISQPGSYLLGGNREMTDVTKPIVEITAPDVTLDLQGFALVFPTPATTGNGIHIAATENVSIRDGSISNAKYGVYADSGKGLTLAHLRVNGGAYGLFSKVGATQVKDCRVQDTTVNGIHVAVTGSSVRNSQVYPAAGVGIYANKAEISHCEIEGGAVGVQLMFFCTLANSRVSGATTSGVDMLGSCVVRNSHIVFNYATGIVASSTGNMLITSTMSAGGVQRGVRVQGGIMIAGTRFAENGINIDGGYVDGGDNTLMW